MPHDRGRKDALTYAVTDTNVFVHYAFFKNVDWAAELSVREVTLVVPPVVLEELDKRKWMGTRREKERVRTVLRAFKELSLSTTPVRIRAGVSILALDDEPDDAFLAHHRLQARAGDDRLLASALAFKERQPNARVLVLTADTGLRIKAPTRQMEVAMAADRLELPDEPDETERALEAARRELAAAKSAAPKLRVIFEGGDPLELEMGLAGPLDPVSRQKLLTDWRKRNPHVSGMPESFTIPGGGQFDMKILSGLPGFITEVDAQNYNAEVDRVFARYGAYLDEWPSMVNRVTRCIDLRLVLENEGTAPADDVHLELWTDARGIWLEEVPGIDEPPKMPKGRSMFDPDLLRATLPHFDVGSLRRRDDPIDGPNIPEGDPVEAQYAVRRVNHHVPCELPKVYFQFERDADVTSFAVNYRLVAANIREPREGILNVKITLRDPAAAPDPEELFADRQNDDD